MIKKHTRIMNLAQLVNKRFSVRKYKNTPVDKEKLLKVLEAGQMAPSAVNFQPRHFVVVSSGEKKKEIHSVYQRDWFKTAPIIIVVCADHSQSWKRGSDGKDSADIDAAIAIDHITLMAAELELGTCWVCNFDTYKCADILKLPNNLEPIALIPLGYPDTEVTAKKRKPLTDIVSLDEYGKEFI